MLMTVLVAVVMAVTLVMLAVYLNRPVSFLAIIIGATAAILGVMINMRRVRAAAQPDEHGIVLGPTRMDYPGTMATVRAVARYLSRAVETDE